LLNIFVNRKTKKFKFKFTLTGLNRNWHRKERIDNLMKLADKGILLNESQFASCLGMNPCDFSRSLDEAHNSDFTQKLTLLLNANTMKDGSQNKATEEKSSGRPQLEITEKTEKTEEVEDYV